MLTQLGVNPLCDDPWPLTIYPRTLAVLAEILLLLQQQEREAGQATGKSQSEASIISIWNRFFYSLVKAIFEADGSNPEFEGN